MKTGLLGWVGIGAPDRAGPSRQTRCFEARSSLSFVQVGDALGHVVARLAKCPDWA